MVNIYFCQGSLNCTDDHFKCDSGVCISREWLCDGDHDCSNGEDERMDDIAKCSKYIFLLL